MRWPLALLSVLTLVALESGCHSTEKVERDTDRDNFMTAKEAQEYGLVDHVLERLSPGQIPARLNRAAVSGRLARARSKGRLYPSCPPRITYRSTPATVGQPAAWPTALLLVSRARPPRTASDVRPGMPGAPRVYRSMQ